VPLTALRRSLEGHRSSGAPLPRHVSKRDPEALVGGEEAASEAVDERPTREALFDQNRVVVESRINFLETLQAGVPGNPLQLRVQGGGGDASVPVTLEEIRLLEVVPNLTLEQLAGVPRYFCFSSRAAQRA
jgi:hypothetical protein